MNLRIWVGLVLIPFVAILFGTEGTFLSDARAEEDVQALEELLGEGVVGGASKALESAQDAPATVVTLSSSDMTRFGVRSLHEAINYLGMGLITQDPLHSVEIGGRGVLLTADYGNHVLVVVDGHAINEQWASTGYFEQGLGIPMEMIDHIELILGPGSVLYGGSAMLGVINVVTKRARNNRGLHLLSECGISPEQTRGKIGTWSFVDGHACRFGAGISLETTLLETPLEVNAFVEAYLQNGPSFAWGPQTVETPDGEPARFGPNTPPGLWEGRNRNQYFTRVPTAHARMVFGDLKLSLHGQIYERATPVPSFNQQSVNFDDPASRERDQWLWGDLQYATRLSENLSFSGRLYGDLYGYEQRLAVDESAYCPEGTSDGCRFTIEGASRWAGLEFQVTQDWLGDERLTTMIGTELRIRWTGSQAESFDRATEETQISVPKTSALNFPWAGYLQQTWSPFRRVRLNAGARFDHDPRGGDHLSPRAALLVQTGEGGTFKLIYSEAFRAPTFYEYEYEDEFQIRNQALEPETVRSIEANIEQRFGAHRVSLGIFRSWWQDMIVTVLVDPEIDIYQFQNASTIENSGFTASFDGTFGAFYYGLSVTGAHTRRSEAGEIFELPVAPQVFGNARLAYDLPGAWPTVALAAWLVGPRPADRAFDGDFPVRPEAPANLESRVTISGPIPFLDHLEYRIAGSISSASVNPYVAGPNQYVGPDGAEAELMPINRLVVFATLMYHLF